MIDEIIKEIDKKYKNYNKPIIANETMGESRARRDGFLSGLLTAKSFVEKQQNLYPNYKELLYKYDSCTTELQIFKDKEDEIRELITSPIDGMSLDRLGRDILQILNEGGDEK